MKRHLLFKSLLLLCALIVGTNAWAESVTFIAGTDKGSTSVTKNGITVSMSTMSRDDNYRTYASSSMTVSSTVGKISSIVITCTGNGTAEYGPGKFSGTGYSYSGYTGTWSGSATSVTLNASSQVRMTQIVVTLEGSGSSHTITAVSNNNTWGTVSLTGTTITATPNDGYQVSSSTPYEVTNGTATVAQSGNAFVVTPSTDCTIQINFEETPTYTVTITTPENGTLAVKVGDNVVSSGDKYPVGTILRITATPNDGYNFKNIQVVDATTHTYTASNVRDYTLTANDTEISANFQAKVYHNVNWYVNGSISSTVPVEEGTAITKPATDPADIDSKKFMGWIDYTIDGTTDTKPTFFTTANMGTVDVNYYAVFATVASEGEDTYEKITSSTLDTNETYVLGAEQSSTNHTMWYFCSYAEVDKNTSWGLSTNTPATTSPLKLTVSGSESALIVQDENGKYIEPWKGNFRMVTASTYATISIDDNGILKGTSHSDNTTTVNLRYNYNGGNGGFRWYDGNSTGTQAYLYKIIPGTTYSNYRTSVPTTATIALNAACTDGAMVYGTYSCGKAFVVPNDLVVSEITVLKGKLWVENYNSGDIVPANTGVMVAALAGGNYDVTLSDEAGSSIFDSDNMLKPSGDAGITAANMTKADTKFYRLTMHNGSEIGFWWGAADGAAFDLAANKAYLAVPNSAQLSREGLWLGDDVTAIETVKTQQADGQYFNLAGQRVAQPTKGLYIVNGKKVIIK